MTRVLRALFFALHCFLLKWKGVNAVVVDVGCCSWDLGNCGTDIWCNASSENCKQCNGFFIYPSQQVGCIPRWTQCNTTSQCCGQGQCIDQVGWRHCNLVDSVPSPSPTQSPTQNPTLVTTTMSPTLPTPLSPTKKPTPLPTTRKPTPSPTTRKPTPFPTTRKPTPFPTTRKPTPFPTTRKPTPFPTTRSPTTTQPTSSPTTRNPTSLPTSSLPTAAPANTPAPYELTNPPTEVVPTLNPNAPSALPDTYPPTLIPTALPTTTLNPTPFPTTKQPTSSPTTRNPTSLPTTSLPTPFPTTKQPTSSPTTTNPTSLPTTSLPTPAPTEVVLTPKPNTPSALPDTYPPTLTPTSLPTTGVPFSSPINPTHSPVITQDPVGDVIGPNNNSERVVLPRPPQPQTSSQQTNCPHNDAGLVDWITLFSPGVGDMVNIPPGTRVIIRQSVLVKLGTIDIPPTSELIIGENINGISLDVSGIFVRGKLTIGSETCRIDSKVVITLHGARPSTAVSNVPDATVKGINVFGGVISLHGKRYFQTWTRLGATANPGDTVLRLQEDVNWDVGQEIVLVTTAMKDSKEWHQNEILKVQSVDNTPSIGSIVYLQTGIAYKHLGIPAYQAEVGLLSRTIVIQGSELDSDPSDSEPRKCSGRWIYGNMDEPCPGKDLTGYGGHIIIQNGGRGHVEGVELYRMGQTNVLGRYPIHFHGLNDCPECYFRDSSVHKSYYRCVSVHATNNLTISENVAFNVAGFCYYLEDGVEQYNKIHFNLAAHIHMIGPSIPNGGGQQTQIYQQTSTATLPADVTAAGFYITNIRNEIIGNAASGGWAGFAFPNLPKPIGMSRNINMRPSSAIPLPGNKLDGNSAHSSGWWWYHAGAFYFGGALYYNSQNVLEYNPGRSFNFNEHNRKICEIDLCAQGNCNGWCPTDKQGSFRLSNSKAFLVPSVGLNSWSGRMEVLGFECHDCGLSIEALEAGFWIDNMLVNCRSGEALNLPPGATANYIPASGFGWYDTDQEHIITRSTFRKCGSAANGGGCNSSPTVGCHVDSSVFSFLTHSSQFNPEIMQGTKSISMESCGRRFRLADFRGAGYTSVSARLQNWLDEDGSVTGLGVRSVIASAYDNGMWWKPDLETQYVPEGPMYFFKLTSGPERGLGHVRLNFDASEHSKVGSSACTNGGYEPCPALGYAKHLGPMFLGDVGLPITAQADIAGPVGGFGWHVKFNQGSPTKLIIELIEVQPNTPLMLYMAYPPGTSFDIFAFAPYCGNGGCKEQFIRLSSAAAVRNSMGNAYYFGNDGMLVIRIIQFSGGYIQDSNGWIFPQYNTTVPWNSKEFLINKFERGGVLLPVMQYGPYIQINANCGTGTYCSQLPPSLTPNPCSSGYQQVAYDKCCDSLGNCMCASGNPC